MGAPQLLREALRRACVPAKCQSPVRRAAPGRWRARLEQAPVPFYLALWRASILVPQSVTSRPGSDRDGARAIRRRVRSILPGAPQAPNLRAVMSDVRPLTVSVARRARSDCVPGQVYRALQKPRISAPRTVTNRPRKHSRSGAHASMSLRQLVSGAAGLNARIARSRRRFRQHT
jgi:hypothetical protein